jgi:DNA-binding XRE family transcriptional regulator
MIDNWLWDRKFTNAQAAGILKDPAHKDFILLASLLLSRHNEPKAVFGKYLDQETFCRYWPSIKKTMRKNSWADPRIVFWQAIYENLLAKYRKKGVLFRKAPLPAKPLYEDVGHRLAQIRKEQGMSQKDLADKMGVSQQLISRVEKGRENVSLSTIKTIAYALGKKATIDFS